MSLGLPVFYVVCEDTAEIHELEGSINRWSMQDFLTSFVRLGHEEYVLVAEYMERTGINICSTISMLGGQTAGSGNFALAFKAGTYCTRTTVHPELIADLVGHCKTEGFAYATNAMFVTALSRIVKVDSFDIEQFKRRVSSHATLLKRQPHLVGYMEMIEAIYNHHSKKKIPLVFLANQAAQSRLPKAFRKDGNGTP